MSRKALSLTLVLAVCLLATASGFAAPWRQTLAPLVQGLVLLVVVLVILGMLRIARRVDVLPEPLKLAESQFIAETAVAERAVFAAMIALGAGQMAGTDRTIVPAAIALPVVLAVCLIPRPRLVFTPTDLAHHRWFHTPSATWENVALDTERWQARLGTSKGFTWLPLGSLRQGKELLAFAIQRYATDPAARAGIGTATEREALETAFAHSLGVHSQGVDRVG